MLVEEIEYGLNTYHYNLVQYHNQKTGEVFNIGVILNDRKTFHAHIPRQFYNLKNNCIEFTEIAGINFTLDVIEDRIKRYKEVDHGNVSNSIFITEELSMLSELSCEDALLEAIDKYMSIKKLRVLDNPLREDKYDKMTILKRAEFVASYREINNFISHRKFEGIARKLIDMSLVDEDENPYSIASVASIHKEHFDDNIITSIYTLQEAMRSESVKDQFLYIPILKGLSAKERHGIDWAKEQAQIIGVDVLTDARPESAIERLTQYKPPKKEIEDVLV